MGEPLGAGRMALHYLSFEISEGDAGVTTLEALAATHAAQHAAVMAEVQQVLDWAAAQFPQGHGPVEEGGDWDHDLQVHIETGGWHAVALTIAASPRFTAALLAAFAIDPI